ncbi:elongation factor G-binding protein, partial [Enterococcus faecalis]
APAEKYLDELQETLLPFKEPSTPQVTKVFRNVKKLKIPVWENMDLRNNTYVGWNVAGTQKKFILAFRENKLIGVHGTLSPT